MRNRVTTHRAKTAKTRRRDDWVFRGLVGLGGLVALALVVGGISLPYRDVRTVSCTVIDKDRTTVTTVSDGQSSSRSDMRIYTEQCDVLQVADMLFIGQFDSASKYNAIQVDQTYEFTISGYRIPFLGTFPHIREVRAA